MEEELYARDYTTLQNLYDHFWDDDEGDGHLKQLTEEDQAHVFLPERYALYQKCLRCLDRYAMRHRGEIYALFSPKNYLGEIRVTLSTCLFEGTDDMDDLLFLAGRVDALRVQNLGEKTVFCVAIRCFLPVWETALIKPKK